MMAISSLEKEISSSREESGVWSMISTSVERASATRAAAIAVPPDDENTAARTLRGAGASAPSSAHAVDATRTPPIAAPTPTPDALKKARRDSDSMRIPLFSPEDASGGALPHGKSYEMPDE